MSLRLNYEFTEASLGYTWRCVICGATAEQTWPIRRGEAVPPAQLPKGWSKLPNWFEFCCPLHEILVVIDGEERYHRKGAVTVEIEDTP